MYKKTKPRSVMELLNKNLSEREVAAILGCSRNTVSEIKELCRQQGMTWDDIQDMTDDGLYDILYPKKFKRTTNYVPVDYAYVHSELKKTGVTMKLLWEEYRDRCVSEGREYCAYPTFTVNYYKYTGEKNYTSHIQHKPGVEAEVDWSGPTMSYVDVDTGEIITAYLFVATLPYSQYGYVEATTDMKEKAWLECHVHMFEFFEGTPVKIVCDNLKTGVVSHPKKGEIILNDAYLALGEYYVTAIMPTGVKKPKQKASVEGSVGKIATAVIAKLRNEIFTSLGSLMRNFEDRRDDLKELTRYRKRLGNYNILIIDEWLNYKLNERDAKMLYELFEQRSGNNSTIFVGQFPVAEWHDRLGGGTQADSIMDRIVHNAYEIPSSETNLRKIYESKKLADLKAEIEK